MSLRLAATKELQPAPAGDQRPKGENPPLRRWWLFAAPLRSNKQPDLNIRGPLLTTYLKRLSIGLFSERLNWANNLQNPIIRAAFPKPWSAEPWGSVRL